MKTHLLSVALFSLVAVSAPVLASPVGSPPGPILQDYGFNINGTGGTYLGIDGSTLPTSPDLNTSGWDSSTTGLGTITFTTTTGGDFDFWILDPAGGPDYNEYGNTGGTAGSNQSGLSWQIDVPDYDSIGDTNHPNTDIIANMEANTLDGTNGVPGTADDYFGTCSTGSDCNDIVSLAMGFTYSAPAAGFEDIITYTVSTTAPASGFYLEAIQPVDTSDGGFNSTPAYLYLTGTITTVPISTTGIPEPKTSILLGGLVLLLAVCFRRRLVGVQPTR